MRKTQGCGWLAKRGDVLEKHLQARLRVPFQNISGIRATNQPWVFRGNKLVPLHPCSSVKSVVSILSLIRCADFPAFLRSVRDDLNLEMKMQGWAWLANHGGVVQKHMISFRVFSCDWWFKSLPRL